MDDSKLKIDWLVNNAVVAFAGALLLGQSFRSPDISREILWGIEPGEPGMGNRGDDLVSLHTRPLPSPRQCHQENTTMGLQDERHPDHVFHVLFLFAYTIGYLQAATELPYDQWWSYFLFFGGYTLMLFLIIRPAFHRSPD